MIFFKKNEVPFFNFSKAIKKPVLIRFYQMKEPFTVETDEGKMKGNAGDYLIIGVKDEMYPCRKDIFEETYEVID